MKILLEILKEERKGKEKFNTKRIIGVSRMEYQYLIYYSHKPSIHFLG